MGSYIALTEQELLDGVPAPTFPARSLEYIDNRFQTLDLGTEILEVPEILEVLVETVPAVLRGRGAS